MHLAHPAPPPGEALWTIDRAGTLAAYDGRTSQPAVRIPPGLPAQPVAPELLPGGGLLWVYAIEGQLIIVDPAAARVVARLTVPPATPPGLGATYHAHRALWLARAERLWRVTGAGQVTHACGSGFGRCAHLLRRPRAAARGRWRVAVPVHPAHGLVLAGNRGPDRRRDADPEMAGRTKIIFSKADVHPAPPGRRRNVGRPR